MTSRDIATICSTLLRIAGVALLVWAPNKESWSVGLALAMGADVTRLGSVFLNKKGDK